MAYESKYQERLDAGLKKVTESEPFTYSVQKPEYTSRYGETIDKLVNGVVNTETFAYNPETDPNFQSYKKQYLREGQRATQNAIGAAAAANGGAVSTAGMTAATQAGDYYASKLADAVPTLYQQAYNKYLDEYSRKLQGLQTVTEQEQQDYNRHRDAVGDWQDDRSFAYSVHLNEYDKANDQLNALQNADETAYSRYLDDQSAQAAAEETAFERQLAYDKLDAESYENQQDRNLQYAKIATEAKGESEEEYEGYPTSYNNAVTQVTFLKENDGYYTAADALYNAILKGEDVTESDVRALCAKTGIAYELLDFCIGNRMSPSEFNKQAVG